MAVTRLRARDEYLCNDEQWKIAVHAEKCAQQRWKDTFEWMVDADEETLRTMEQERAVNRKQHQQQQHRQHRQGSKSRKPASAPSKPQPHAHGQSHNSKHDAHGLAPPSSAAALSSLPMPLSPSNSRAHSAATPKTNRTQSVKPESRPGSSRPPSKAKACWGHAAPPSSSTASSASSSRAASARSTRPPSSRPTSSRPRMAATATPSTSDGHRHHGHHHHRPAARRGQREGTSSTSSSQQSYFTARIPLRSSDAIGWGVQTRRLQQQQQQRQQPAGQFYGLSRPQRQYAKPWLTNANLPGSRRRSTASASDTRLAGGSLRSPAPPRAASSAHSTASSTMTVGEFEERYLKNQGPVGSFVATPFASVGLGVSAPVADRHRQHEQRILDTRHPVLSQQSSRSHPLQHTQPAKATTPSLSRGSTSCNSATSSRPVSSIQAIELTTNIYKRQRSGFRPEQI